MSPIKATTIALTLILTSGFGAVTFAKDIKTNSNTVNPPATQKNIKEIKTPSPKDTPSQQKGCIRAPYC